MEKDDLDRINQIVDRSLGTDFEKDIEYLSRQALESELALRMTDADLTENTRMMEYWKKTANAQKDTADENQRKLDQIGDVIATPGRKLGEAITLISKVLWPDSGKEADGS